MTKYRRWWLLFLRDWYALRGEIAIQLYLFYCRRRTSVLQKLSEGDEVEDVLAETESHG